LAKIIVEVSIPSVLSILAVFPVEVPVGTLLHAAATLKTSNGVFAQNKILWQFI
jgi:nuclear pore complex protein Nup210